MNFGIIGAGMISEFHAQAIQAIPDASLLGFFNHRTEKASALGEKFGARSYPTLGEMLKDPKIDIVTIATPSGAHLEPAREAIRAGKHVIVEKPLEITTERIDEMTTAAKEHGVTLAAILNRRFHPAMDLLKSAVKSGRFGTLTSASAYIKWYRSQDYYDSAGWRGTWALDGGGALMNQGIHTIDALLHLAGPVKSVQASTDCMAHTGIEVEDTAAALLVFKNGAHGVIEGSTCAWSKSGHPARIQLAGTHGSVFMADESFEVWEFLEETEDDERIRNQHSTSAGPAMGAADPKAIGYGQHQRNFEEVITSIKRGVPPVTSPEEARKSVELIQAIYQSAREGGRKIEL
ncbi:MAG: Gfo/Idh/MocA family oxidoreductase [Verrucomicrobiota bacterium]